jgi:hypothetical protein
MLQQLSVTAGDLMQQQLLRRQEQLPGLEPIVAVVGDRAML